jgi:ankyrin repeat protein
MGNHKFEMDQYRKDYLQELRLLDDADDVFLKDDLELFKRKFESYCEQRSITTSYWYGNIQLEGLLLLRAVRRRAYDCCEYMLSKGVSVHARVSNDGNKDGLLTACSFHRLSFRMVKLLVDNGADVNSVDDHNESGLMHSCRFHGADMDSIAFLVEHGADVNIVSFGRQSCLTIAISFKNKKLFWFLLKNGARLNNDQDMFTFWELPDYFSYFSTNYDWTEMVLVLCSVKSITRISKGSKLGLLSSSLIREFCSVYLKERYFSY